MLKHTLTSWETENDKPEYNCAIRAFANFMDVPYAEAFDVVAVASNYRPGYGCRNDLYHNLLVSLGFKYVKKVVRLTAKNAQDRLPDKAILHFTYHAAAYKNGAIMDAFVTTNHAGMKQVRGYWFLPEEGE